MAPADPLDAKPAPFEGSVNLGGLEKVLGASRLVSASRPRTGNERQHGGDKELICANEEPDHALKMPARWLARNQSWESCSKEAETARRRAITTRCRPGFNSGRDFRANSLSRRRTRLRSTAHPILREVISPICAGEEFPVSSEPRTKYLPWLVLPSALILWNSEARFRRADLGKQRRMARAARAGCQLRTRLRRPG